LLGLRVTIASPEGLPPNEAAHDRHGRIERQSEIRDPSGDGAGISTKPITGSTG